MIFPHSIKWRMTTGYLLILLVILFVICGFSYFLLTRAVYSNEAAPSIVYTMEIDIPNSIGNTGSTENYKMLSVYILPSEKTKAIQAGTASLMRIGTSIGELSFDQSKFITADAQGSQKVWIYYRLSPTDMTKYELMIIVRPVAATRLILGQFTNILIYALPVIIILVFVVGFFLLKRMLQPIDIITKTVQQLNNRSPYKNINVPSGSEFRELTSSLNGAFGRLQATVDRERQMVADVSHEIRTPLTVMQGEATLALRRKRTVEEYEKCLQVFSTESAYLAAMVNQLLLIAQLDYATDLQNAEEVNLSSLLAELSLDFKVLCEQHALTFKFVSETGVLIHGNKLKLRELFFNLIDNAVKYSHQGKMVSLSLKRDNGFARVDISDEGIGIKQEDLGKIFNRFYRINTASSRDDGGAGLGLAICKRIVELHKGRIEVKSEHGQGSTFSVFLPIFKL